MTIPEPVPTVAIVVLPLDQLPPVVSSESVFVRPTQTSTEPEIGAGNGFIETITVAIQLAPNWYCIVAVPTDCPVTAPLIGSTVAIAVALLLHVPPVMASLSTDGKPTQSLVFPVIAGNVAAETTSTVVVTIQVDGNV